MDDFERIFDKIARTDDASVLWTNWLDWVIDQNLIIDHDRGLNFKGNEYAYFDLYISWVELLCEKLKNNFYYDYLGEFYENVIQSKYKSGNLGQFFTPMEVSELMSKLIVDDKKEVGVVNDCACGSGRLLLDAYKNNHNVLLIGQDVDSVACKMCVLNFYIHGVKGSVLHQNTLTGEFYEAWRVNNYLGHGLDIPHIELVSESEAYNFIGYTREQEEVDVKKESVGQVTLDFF